MPKVHRGFVFGLLLGGLVCVVLAAPCSAETVSAGEAQRVLAAMPDVVSARPSGLQYGVAGPPYGTVTSEPAPYGAAPYGSAPYAPAPYAPAPSGPVAYRPASYGGGGCCPSPCAAPCANPCDNPCWEPCSRWTLMIGAWAWGFDGTIGDEGREFDVDTDWQDSLENLDDFEFALDARVRWERGRWSATLMVNGGNLEAGTDSDGFDTDAEMSLWIAQAQVGFGLFGGRLGCGPCAPVACVEVYAGARAYWVDQEIDLDPGSTVGLTLDASNEWIDPIVGLRGELHIRDRWTFVLEGDVGGFDVGSELSWHLMGTVMFHFTKHFGIYAGWKVLDVDYEDDDFVWDVQLSGPFAGLVFTF